jgi:hypothetical protein
VWVWLANRTPILRETRRRSYGGNVSGYPNTSLSLVFAAGLCPYAIQKTTGSRDGVFIITSPVRRVVARVPRTAFCFIQSAPTGFTARVFSYHNRDFLKEAFEGPEPDEGL